MQSARNIEVQPLSDAHKMNAKGFERLFCKEFVGFI